MMDIQGEFLVHFILRQMIYNLKQWQKVSSQKKKNRIYLASYSE